MLSAFIIEWKDEFKSAVRKNKVVAFFPSKFTDPPVKNGYPEAEYFSRIVI